MSAILGGLFNSRLNRKLREEKGYTYGAGAGFDMRRGAGPFAVRAAVNTEVTVPALQDMLVELDAMRDAPPTRDELHAARDYLVGVFPLRFETPPGRRRRDRRAPDPRPADGRARPLPAGDRGRDRRRRPRRGARPRPARRSWRSSSSATPTRSCPSSRARPSARSPSSARSCPPRARRPTLPDPARSAAPANSDPGPVTAHPHSRGLPGRIIESFPALGSPDLPPLPARLDDPHGRLRSCSRPPRAGSCSSSPTRRRCSAWPARSRRPADLFLAVFAGRARRSAGPPRLLVATNARSASFALALAILTTTGLVAVLARARARVPRRTRASRSRCPRPGRAVRRSSTGRRSATRSR